MNCVWQGVDWSLVRYMVGEVELGAQLTDANDIRLLTTLCEMWLSDDLFSPTFTFTPSVANPRSSSLEEYLDYFNSLHDCDSPETFELMPTADGALVNTCVLLNISVCSVFGVVTEFMPISALKVIKLCSNYRTLQKLSEVLCKDTIRLHGSTSCKIYFVS